MTATIQKWGNSHGIRLPKMILDALSISEGEQVNVSVENGSILIKPMARRRKTIEELFEGYTGDYCGEEIDWGDPVGEEIW